MNEPIQMLWIGPRLRYLEHVCMQSFIDVGHAVHCYTYGDVANMPESVQTFDANALIPGGNIFTYPTGPGRGSYAAFANLFRYKLLSKKGGWWSDADVFCVKRWDFPNEFVFTHEPNSLILVHNGIMKAPAGSIVMDYLYSTAKGHDPTRLRWGETGSKLLTQAKSQFREIRDNIQPSNTFCPIFWGHITNLVRKPPKVLPGDVYGVHLFQEMWRRRNINTDKEQPIFTWLQNYAKELSQHD